MTREGLTLLSTSCIVLSGVALLAGWVLIRDPRRVTAHRNAMLVATTLAGLFLVTYVTRWALFGSAAFAGTGAWRVLYLAILVPHVLLAIAVGPLALRQIRLGLGARDLPAHRRLGRVLAPMWLFVAASGWAIWWMLYRFPTLP
jgi:putative membrane protein